MSTQKQQSELSAAGQAILGAIDGTVAPEAEAPVVETPAETPAVETPVVETPAETPAVAPVVETPAVETPAETPAETPVVETPAEAPAAERFIENPMFVDGKLSLGAPAAEQNPDVFSFETMDEANAFLKENFETTDLSKISTDFKAQGERITALTEDKVKLDSHEDFIKNLPPALYKGLQLHNEGKDWREAIKDSSALDYTKKASDHDKEALVNAFNPGSFSSEDWAEYGTADIDPTLKKNMDGTIALSEKMYTLQQGEIDTHQKAMVATQENRITAFNDSLATTMAGVGTSLEGLAPAYVDSIKTSIMNNEIMSHFYDSNGALKPNAAQDFIMARDGHALLGQYKKEVAAGAVSKERQEQLDKGANRPPEQGGGSAGVVDTSGLKDYYDKIFGG